MNINDRMSYILWRYENHYNKCNIMNSKYLRIKRESSGKELGFFSYFITNVGWIDWALRHGMIPVVDMQWYINPFITNDEIGKVNAYEQYFNQPCGIGVNEALQSRNARTIWKDVPPFHPNDSLEFLYNDKIVEYYRKVVKKYVNFTDETKNILATQKHNIMRGGKTLGVLARGTDYVDLKPYNHPIQPNVEELVYLIKKYRSKYECDKIYVATEDSRILERMKLEFGKDLLYTNQRRIGKTKTLLNANNDFTNGISPFQRGMENLISVWLLSQCSGLIAGSTSGTIGAVLLADKYEFMHIYTSGRYGREDEIIRAGEKYL